MTLGIHFWEIDNGEVEPDLLIDIRTDEQFQRARIPGAVSLPYTRFQAEAEALTRSVPLVLVIDAEGARAAEMAVWLNARGATAQYLIDGMSGWRGPLEQGGT